MLYEPTRNGPVSSCITLDQATRSNAMNQPCTVSILNNISRILWSTGYLGGESFSDSIRANKFASFEEKEVAVSGIYIYVRRYCINGFVSNKRVFLDRFNYLTNT